MLSLLSSMGCALRFETDDRENSEGTCHLSENSHPATLVPVERQATQYVGGPER